MGVEVERISAVKYLASLAVDLAVSRKNTGVDTWIVYAFVHDRCARAIHAVADYVGRSTKYLAVLRLKAGNIAEAEKVV